MSRGHKKTNEASEMPHICKYCKKDVVGAENFKHHEFSHLRNTCQLCGKNFLVANKLKRHFENCQKIHGNSKSESIQNKPRSEDFIFQDFKKSQKFHENSTVDVIQNISSSSTTTEKRDNKLISWNNYLPAVENKAAPDFCFKHVSF